jgi:PhoU domain-containing protein
MMFRINRRYREEHEDALALVARQTPVAGDLRLIAALLDTVRGIERMGDQCANIAKLVPLSGSEATSDADILATIERMGELVRSQVSQAEEAFDTRDVALARELVSRDGEVNRLDREVFIRAVEVGGDLEVREWAMFMVLVGRCLGRIAENAVNRRADGVRRDRAVPGARERIAARVTRSLFRRASAPESEAGRPAAVEEGHMARRDERPSDRREDPAWAERPKAQIAWHRPPAKRIRLRAVETDGDPGSHPPGGKDAR